MLSDVEGQFRDLRIHVEAVEALPGFSSILSGSTPVSHDPDPTDSEFPLQTGRNLGDFVLLTLRANWPLSSKSVRGPAKCGWSVRLSANHCCRVSGGTARKPSSGAAPVLATVLIFLAIRGALSLRAGAAQSHDHRVGAPDREGGAVILARYKRSAIPAG
jgi:hypothetical protein